MDCAYCDNRGTFWVEDGARVTCIPCPVCQGKSVKLTDLRAARNRMKRHYAEMNRTKN